MTLASSPLSAFPNKEGGSNGIIWTDKTWNAFHGCTQISAGCLHCYAKSMANRLRGHANAVEMCYHNGFMPAIVPHKIDEPAANQKPTVYFVGSMGDIGHEAFSYDFIESLLQVMARCPRHRFLLLTKRPERLADFFRTRQVPGNVWVGTTVESAAYISRIDILRTINATVRFLSYEPAIGALGTVNLDGIHWVIAAGETGGEPRRLNLDWVREVRDQCIASNVALLYKQKGGKARSPDRKDRTLDGRTWDQMPMAYADFLPLLHAWRPRRGTRSTAAQPA